MKKKGLIISTVVMVVVLIASLTTATYAWFSSTATVSVDKFNMSTAAMEGLSIGVKGTADGTVGNIGDYFNGEVTYGSAWTGNAGLGSSLKLSAPFINDGIAHATIRYDASQFGADKMYGDATTPEDVAAGDFITATAYAQNDPENPTPTEFAASVANKSYLDMQIGLRATADGVKQIWYTITVEFTAAEGVTIVDALKPGMAAALMFEITVGNNAPITVNAFDGHTLGTAFTGSDGVGKTQNNTESALVTWTYSGFVYNDATEAIDDSIQVVRVKAWIEGSDDACRTRLAGTGAQIGIEFAYNAEATAKEIENGVLKA